MSYIHTNIVSARPKSKIMIMQWQGDLGEGFFSGQEVIFEGRTRESNIKKARHRARQKSAGYKALDKKIVIKNFENIL